MTLNSTTGAEDVVFTDTPDADTTLVVGSVTTTSGSVGTGNTGGDTTIDVEVGTMSASTPVTITFDVVVNQDAGAQVCNQGSIDFANDAPVVASAVTLTDDPDVDGVEDPTCTPIDLPNPANLTATKTDAVLIDNDSGNDADPGDTLRYTVTLNSTTGAEDVVFTDTPDADTTLVVGSVTTSTGSVVTGNTGGDTTIDVDVGTMSANTPVTITFDVVVNQDAGAQVCNQGSIDFANDAPVVASAVTLTDDPDVDGVQDPTCTPIAEQEVTVPTMSKTANPNAVPASGGDVSYTLTVENPQDGVSWEIDSLTDDQFGDLDGVGTCDVSPPPLLLPGQTYQCSFVEMISGPAGTSHVNNVTADISPAAQVQIQALVPLEPTTIQASASVYFAPVPVLTKTANPGTVLETGDNVTFNVRIDNPEDGLDWLIDSLMDDQFGDLDGLGTCDMSPSPVLHAGDTYSCEFTEFLQGPASTTHVITVMLVPDQSHRPGARRDHRTGLRDGDIHRAADRWRHLSCRPRLAGGHAPAAAGLRWSGKRRLRYRA